MLRAGVVKPVHDRGLRRAVVRVRRRVREVDHRPAGLRIRSGELPDHAVGKTDDQVCTIGEGLGCQDLAAYHGRLQSRCLNSQSAVSPCRVILGRPIADDGKRPGTRKGIARLRADRAVDAIRERFGWAAVTYASAVSGASRSVPDDFRSLAEKDL